jgi:hypothetical protein
MTTQASSKETTIRELGAELWAELAHRLSDDQISWKARNLVVDIVMGVLARHEGEVLENDVELAVAPLPPI